MGFPRQSLLVFYPTCLPHSVWRLYFLLSFHVSSDYSSHKLLQFSFLLCQSTITYLLRNSMTDSTDSAIPPGNTCRTCATSRMSPKLQICVYIIVVRLGIRDYRDSFGQDMCSALLNMCSKWSKECKSLLKG